MGDCGVEPISWIYDEAVLCKLIECASEPYKTQAWEQMQTWASNGSLMLVIRFAPEPYKAQAWEVLMQREFLPGHQLSDIIIYCPEPYKAKAWKELKSRSTFHLHLFKLASQANKSYRAKAEKELEKDRKSNNISPSA